VRIEKMDIQAQVTWIDGGIVLLYLFLTILISWYAFYENRKKEEESATTTTTTTTTMEGGSEGGKAEHFFLAGRDIAFWGVACSLFVSNIGSEHFIGLAGSGAVDGLSVSMGEWGSPLFILLLGWLFVPFYLKTKVYTMPEFIER
jgi:Na+/proline symporter